VSRAASASDENKVQVYVSFDVEHDGELYDLLVEQSQAPGSGFVVASGSRRSDAKDENNAGARRRIGNVAQVIVICGEQTAGCVSVVDELRAAQEQNKPYFLVWGRRESMCTKPEGAKPSDGMYSWTADIIEEQIAQVRRAAEREARASALKRQRGAPRAEPEQVEAPSGD